MITLHTSNRTERLVDALIRNMGQGASADPIAAAFATSHVIVPNANVRAYLQFAVAERHGIAANIVYDFMPGFLARLCRETERRDPDANAMQSALLGILAQPDVLDDETLAPVRRYLDAAKGDAELRELRRFQLTREIARHFDRYRYDRTDLVEAWGSGNLVLSDAFGDTERWQAALWRRLFADDGPLPAQSADGTRWLDTLRVLRDLDNDALPLPAQVHVFGLSYTSTALLDVLTTLHARAEVFVYLLHPCVELGAAHTDALPWAGMTPSDLLGALRAEQAPLLGLWGAPARLHHHLLSTAGNATLREDFVLHPQPDTLLARLQQDIVERVPCSNVAQPTRHQADGSLRVLACPSIQRELETIASEIWEVVLRSHQTPGVRPLELHDIAVVVVHANKDAYLARVPTVFEGAHHLPHNIVDLRPETSSRYVEALTLLLALPFGCFNREELLALMTHPNVVGRWDDVDPHDWERWCEALGIVHGGDHADHADTYIEADVFNWDQGIRRLTLGAFMTGDRSGAPARVEHDGRVYVPQEMAADQLGSAARFATLARALIAEARLLRQASLSFSEWSEALLALADQYLVATDPEDPIPARCRRVLRDLADADLGDGRPVSYRVAYELVRAGIGGVQVERGQYLARGVVVSSFLPLRPIPFRVIFVAGLGEGQFPARDASDPLDLRLAAPRPTDVTAREADRIMFLETLLLAGEQLVLSFVARDAQTGGHLQPSSVVDELLSVVESHYLGAEHTRRDLTTTIPLRRFDERYIAEDALPSHLYARPDETDAAAMRASLQAAWPADALWPPSRATLEATLPVEARDALRERLRLAVPPAAPGPSCEDRVELSRSALEAFLKCPLQGGAKYVLSMFAGDGEDLYAKRDEDFELGMLDRIGLLRDAYEALFGVVDAPLNKSATAAAYDDQAEARRRLGKGPYAVFAEGERARDLETLTRWVAASRARGLHGLRPFAARSFGRAELGASVTEALPGIVLSIPLASGGKSTRTVTFELYGTTGLVDPAGEHFVKQIESPKLGTSKFHHWLGAWVDHLVLSALGRGGPRSATVCARYQVGTCALPECDVASARATLAAIVGDLFGQVHDTLLPFDLVAWGLDKHRRDPHGKTHGEHVRVAVLDSIESYLEDASHVSFQSLYGPIRNVERFEPPAPADIEAAVDRRFGPLMDSLFAMTVTNL